MTVREAFSKTFVFTGDFTCHIGSSFFGEYGIRYSMESVQLGPTIHKGSLEWTESGIGSKCFEFPLGPNISDRPASAFRGFFGEEYDKVLDEAGL